MTKVQRIIYSRKIPEFPELPAVICTCFSVHSHPNQLVLCGLVWALHMWKLQNCLVALLEWVVGLGFDELGLCCCPRCYHHHCLGKSPCPQGDKSPSSPANFPRKHPQVVTPPIALKAFAEEGQKTSPTWNPELPMVQSWVCHL